MSGLIWIQLFDTLMVLLKEFFEKVDSSVLTCVLGAQKNHLIEIRTDNTLHTLTCRPESCKTIVEISPERVIGTD